MGICFIINEFGGIDERHYTRQSGNAVWVGDERLPFGVLGRDVFSTREEAQTRLDHIAKMTEIVAEMNAKAEAAGFMITTGHDGELHVCGPDTVGNSKPLSIEDVYFGF